MKKILLFLLLTAFFCLPSKAVLNERDLAQSLSVLKVELQQAYLQQKQNMQRWKQMNEAQHNRMLGIMKKSSQVSLMLYSQKEDYVFDLTYACHEATQMYMDFKRSRAPYDLILNKMQTEVDRYKGLVDALEALPPSKISDTESNREAQIADSVVQQQKRGEPFELDAQGQKDREECLVYAKALMNNFLRFQQQIQDDSENYEHLDNHLSKLNDYATQRYHDIQQNIFSNAGVTYPTVLSRLPMYFNYAKKDVEDKYSTEGAYKKVRSEWRGSVVWGYVMFVLMYLLLAVVLSMSIMWILKRKLSMLKSENVRKKLPAITFTAGVIIFAVSIMVARYMILTHNFYLMASGLLVEFAWLLTAILVSLLIRFTGDQIKNGLKIYMPIILMGLIIIVFRIVFIPNMLVNLIFPPIVVCFTIWQWNSIRKNKENIPHSDMFYTWISFAVMVVSSCCSMIGYTLLSVEILIWWLFQLTAIQTITLAFELLRIYEHHKLRKRLLASGLTAEEIEAGAGKGDYITQTWFFDLVSKALVPIAAVYSVLLCIYLAADVFDLSQICLTIFLTPILDVQGVIQLSLFKLVVVVALYFIFKYAVYALKSFYRNFRLTQFLRKSGDRQVRTNEINLTLGYNVISILIWGFYLIVATIILKIPKSGISIITAGLATGIGFAMKDILNNFFYGIQLMAGRLRVGDIIECDGIRGKVESITYQSTQINTLDDSVMAFLNSTLFSKNFKNLTRNHSYELVSLPIGVAYGTDVEKVRALLCNAVMSLQKVDKYERHLIDPERGVKLLFDGFGDSSVDLKVSAWVLVAEKVAYSSQAKEIIYRTLNENNIEIPFPQRDLHVKQMPAAEK